MEKLYTIGDAAAELGMPASTIRFYEKNGLIPNQQRSSDGRRLFDEDDLEWMRFVERLKVSGMPIKEIREYIQLYIEGDSTIEERRRIVYERRAAIDAQLEENLSDHSEYLLASQVANAGAVLLSRASDASEEDIARTTEHLNRAMESVGCARRFGSDVIACEWDALTDADFARIMDSGYIPESYVKRHEALDGAYRSLYFLNQPLTADEAREKAQKLLGNPACGNIFRVKGFVNDGGWLQLNATKKSLSLAPIAQGQEVIIAIGEELNEERIRDIVENRKG